MFRCGASCGLIFLGTPAHLSGAVFSSRDTGGLFGTPAGFVDRDALAEHLGKDVVHASIDRNFHRAYKTVTTEDGQQTTRPRYYRLDSEALGKCEYAVLTNKQHAAVMVVDVD